MITIQILHLIIFFYINYITICPKTTTLLVFFRFSKKKNHKLYRNLKKKLYHIYIYIYILKSTQHYIYIGVIGPGVHIYEYVGPGA